MTTQLLRTRARIPTLAALIGAGIFVAMLLAAKPAHAAAPPNNPFDDATPFGTVPGTVSGSNVDATRQTGEPDNGEATVWWRWAAPETGRYHLDTCKTVPEFASIIGVYAGPSVSQLTQKANSYEDGGAFDCPDGSGSVTYFDAVAGTLYSFSVGTYYGFDEQSQSIRLSVRRTPLNDNFAAARPFGKAHGTVLGRNVEATRQNSEPENGDATVWWRWTAPKSGRFRLDTCKTVPEFASIIGVYVGPNVAQLLQKANSYEDGGAFDCPDGSGSVTYFDAVAGTTYSFSVGTYYGFDEQSRNLRLTLISQACLDARRVLGQAERKVTNVRGQFEAAQQRYRTAQGEEAKRKAYNEVQVWKGRLADANQARNEALGAVNRLCP